MPTKKKAVVKKKITRAARPKAMSKAASKVSVHARSIKAGRDVVIGDQYNDFRQQVARIESPQAFVTELGQLQAQIAALKQTPQLTPAQTQTIEVVEGQVKEVIEEAKKPQPLGARITATLTGAKAVMDSLSGSVASAVGLGATIAGFGAIALKLFGG